MSLAGLLYENKSYYPNGDTFAIIFTFGWNRVSFEGYKHWEGRLKIWGIGVNVWVVGVGFNLRRSLELRCTEPNT